ncbi:MAG: DUF4012 domain-containing protein [Acidimicrobiales bacterium]
MAPLLHSEWKAPRRWPHGSHRRRRAWRPSGGGHGLHRRPDWARRDDTSPKARSSKPLVVAAVALAALAAIAGLVLFRDLTRVRSPLAAARTTLRSAADDPNFLRTDEGRTATQAKIDAALVSVDVARQRVLGSGVLSVVGHIPVLRGQRSGLLQLIDDSAAASTAGRDLVARVDALADRTTVRDGAVPVDALRDLTRDLEATSSALGALARPKAGLWGPVGDARRQFDETARSTSVRLGDGAAALGAALPFMGADGDRVYLVAAQNNAEMRDQGMVLSYAIVRFTGGRISMERNGSVGEIPLKGPAPTRIPVGTASVFGSLNPTTLWHSVNSTADFGWSGRAMSDMYRQATGERVDGVIAVDVPALAGLLSVLGPIRMPGISEPVTAENVGRILLHDLYEGLPPGSDQAPRRERLSELTKEVVTAIRTGSRDAVALGRQLGDAAAGGHVKLWSAAPAEQDVFVRTGLGGGPASIAPDRTFHVAVQNRTATKLDYYVKTSVRQVIDLARNGDAVVHTTVIVENRAPADAPPSYQLGPDKYTSRPGEYRAAVYLWAPVGSQDPPGPVEESGLLLTQHTLLVNPGQRLEVPFPDAIIRDAVRDGRVGIRLVPQPRLEPADLEVRINAKGWHMDANPVWSGPWNRTVTPTWRVRR